MCWWAAAAQGVLGIASGIMQQQAAEQNAVAQGEAVRQNAINAIKQSNWKYQDFWIKKRDAFDVAVNDLIKVHLQGQARAGTIGAAINENQSGNTANLLARNVQTDIAIRSASIKDNYDRKGNEIDLNVERTLESTKDYVNNLKTPEMPDRTAMYLNTASSIVGAFSTAGTFKANRAAKGIKTDFWS